MTNPLFSGCSQLVPGVVRNGPTIVVKMSYRRRHWSFDPGNRTIELFWPDDFSLIFVLKES